MSSVGVDDVSSCSSWGVGILRDWDQAEEEEWMAIGLQREFRYGGERDKGSTQVSQLGT